MQKLLVKLKNTPMDASQVHSSVNLSLNRDQSLSEMDKVLANNNLDVNQRQHAAEQKLSATVYVISVDGKPLMPTTPRKARILLKSGKAKVVKRAPFTIKLNYKTTEFVQNITLGIDSGYSNIGYSAVSEKKELISGTLELDNKTKDRLKEKAMYRRGRRNKLWYRKTRFNNRAIPDGWFPPSIQRRYNTHINLINKIKKILPITKVIVEVGNFDIQKINNPNISGKEYQEGNLLGYRNVKSFLISREKGKCQLCGKEKGNDGWNIHHIKQKNKGGTDKPDNLALLHKICHKKLHKESLKLSSKNKVYKQSTFMNIIKNKFIEDIKCKLTYGYITANKRIEFGINKSHNNDAFVIADGSNQVRCKEMSIKQKRRNNRALQLNRKGFKPSIRKQRYKIQPMDLVKIDNKIYHCNGTHCKGTRVMINKKSININKITWSFNYGSFVY